MCHGAAVPSNKARRTAKTGDARTAARAANSSTVRSVAIFKARESARVCVYVCARVCMCVCSREDAAVRDVYSGCGVGVSGDGRGRGRDPQGSAREKNSDGCEIANRSDRFGLAFPPERAAPPQPLCSALRAPLLPLRCDCRGGEYDHARGELRRGPEEGRKRGCHPISVMKPYFVLTDTPLRLRERERAREREREMKVCVSAAMRSGHS